MPIKGMTDAVEARFGVLGKLRKGGEKTASGYGPDLDHWRFTSDNPEVMEAFRAVYGDAPKSVQVFIPYATPDEAFATWCEIWGKTGLVHRCDGETMSIWLEGGGYKRGSKPCTGGHDKNDPLADAVGRLSVIIPELVQAGYVGTVTMETHSKHDILNISRVLEAVAQTRQNDPLGLRGVLFNMRRVQESVSVPGFGKQAGARSRVDKWMVRLEPAADWVRLQLDMAHNQAMMLDSGDALALPEGDVIDAASYSQPALEAPKPAAPAPAKNETTAEVGVQLWQNKWTNVKEAVLKAAGGEVSALDKFVKDRKNSVLNSSAAFAEHVVKSWPDMGDMVDRLEREHPGYNRIGAITGIAKVDQMISAGNGPTESEMWAVIETAALA